MTAIRLEAGFADPVLDAQACFRALLDAFAHPGSVVGLSGRPTPAPWWPSTGAILQTLVDQDTPLWLDRASADAGAAVAFVKFHCGARIVRDLVDASFVLATTPDALPPLDALPRGDDASPERSATLILQVASLGSGDRVLLSGPGIADVAELAVAGVPARFWREWAANHARFPRGVDVLFAAPDAIVALPRTTRAEC